MTCAHNEHLYDQPAAERADLSVTPAMEQPLHDEFLDIYQRRDLRAVFQPIVDISRQGIYGYEALVRGPEGSAFERPLQLFRAASALDLDCDFELLCRYVAIKRFAELKLGHLLFLNISPALLLSRDFKKGRTLQFLREYDIDPKRIVIEVTEHRRIHEYDILNNALNYYRDLGFKVALDDLGSGYSSLRLWTEVLPDFIKIDKHFIRDIDSNKIKQSFIRGLLEISSGSNCKIIAEGIERREEFEFLSGAGVNYQQGYYFAMPAGEPPLALDRDLLHTEATTHLTTGFAQDKLKSITRRIGPVPDSTTVREVLELLQKQPDTDLIPVVRDGLAVGLVERARFLNTLMQTLYGLELYGKMGITDFLEEQPLLVDLNCSLETASQSVTSGRSSVQAFIVTEHQRYLGVCTVLDLLHLITEQQICSARHANPLTLLPGVQVINDSIERLLYSGTAFSLAYFDLDNFKPYNDNYGYDAGDLVIKKLAAVLKDVYRKESSLIGHIGGDDFVVVDISRDAERNCHEVLGAMERAIPAFYRAEHVETGGITGVDRRGNPSFFPLLSVSTGLLPARCTSGCRSHQEIADLASRAKKQAKQREGNSLLIYPGEHPDAARQPEAVVSLSGAT